MSDTNDKVAEASVESTRLLDNAMIFSGKFADEAQKIPDEIWCLSEYQLSQKFTATTVDFLLRRNIIGLLEKARATGQTSFQTTDIFKGVCSKQYFYARVVTDSYRIVWLMTPVHNHQDLIDESFYFCLKKVRDEILTMTVTEKSAPIIMKAMEFFTNRALGPMLQKIEQRSMNVTVDGNKAMREALNPEDMQAKFAELQAKLVSLPSTAVIVDEPE